MFPIDLDLALQPRSDHVKLHVTLMNSAFPEYQCSVNGNSVDRTRLTFDARKIMEVNLEKEIIEIICLKITN